MTLIRNTVFLTFIFFWFSAETIRHLASKTHVEAVKRFWFENGGDVGKRSLFHFSEIDLEKVSFSAICLALLPSMSYWANNWNHSGKDLNTLQHYTLSDCIQSVTEWQ